jgi:hypothetical protein
MTMTVVHVQPVASANKFIRGIPREGVIGFGTKVRFIEAAHNGNTNRRLSAQVDVPNGVFVAAAACVYISPTIFA